MGKKKTQKKTQRKPRKRKLSERRSSPQNDREQLPVRRRRMEEDDDTPSPEDLEELARAIGLLDDGEERDKVGDDKPRSDESSDPEPKKRKLQIDGRRNLTNPIMPPPLRIGVITWNVAHFGEGPLALLSALRDLYTRMLTFDKLEATGYLAKLATYMYQYSQWDDRYREIGQVHRTAIGKRKAAKELERAKLRDCGASREKPEIERTEQDGDEAVDEEDDVTSADHPLAKQLFATWKEFDSTVFESEKEVVEHWKGYVNAALKGLAQAWQRFDQAWQALRELDEVSAQDRLLTNIDMVGLLKELRAAAKMLLRPLLSLRDRVGLAKKMMTAMAKRKPMSSKSTEARVAARGCLTAAAKSSSWRVGPVLNRVVDLDKMVHRVLVANLIVVMFRKNDWLHAILLQEVNKGVDVLEQFLRRKGLECIRGFKLESKSGQGSQTEYYPIVLRSFGYVRNVDAYAGVYNDKGSIYHTSDKGTPPSLTWNKSESLYRPILCYDLTVGYFWEQPRPVRLGIVHTSPAGSEFSRGEVYAQVEAPLHLLAGGSTPTIVGGDFYLTAEAVTLGWNDLTTSTQARATEVGGAQAKIARERLTDLRERAKLCQDEQELERLNARMKQVESFIAEIDQDKIQLIRNDERACISVAKGIEGLGFVLHQPLTGTNWKTKVIDDWLDAQIADFFVSAGPNTSVTPQWKRVRVGIVHPDGGLWDADDELMSLAKFWRYASDHFPVGGVFSTDFFDTQVDAPFTTTTGSKGLLGNQALPLVPVPLVQQPARRILGILNTHNQCYVNAALQMLIRIGAGRIVQDGGAHPLGAAGLREALAGFMATHADEGQRATYQAWGGYDRYTSGSTLAIRRALLNGVIRSVDSQEDSGEVLGKFLEALDKYHQELDLGAPVQIEQCSRDGSWGRLRPSKLHFVLRVTTTYDLGRLSQQARGDVIRVDAQGRHVSYRVDNMLRIDLPPDPSEQPEQGRAKPTLQQLCQATFDVDHGGQGEQVAVETDQRRYPCARRRREQVAFASAEPDNLLVVLNRFWTERVEVRARTTTSRVTEIEYHGRKRSTRVDVPMQLGNRNLRAFILHRGASSNSGHYVAYVHAQELGDDAPRWWQLDDSNVRPIDDISDIVPDAYVLYYELQG